MVAGTPNQGEQPCSPFPLRASRNVGNFSALCPQLDARFSRFTDFKQENGKLTVLAYGHAGKPKVMWYDTAGLVRKGAFITALTVKGTIFTMDSSIRNIIVMYTLIAGIAFSVAHFFLNVAGLDSSELEAISNYLNRFIPFILGLYVALSLSRWWDLRTLGIGTVLDSCQNIALITAAMTPCQGPEFSAYQDQLLKYALASISLIVNMCRPAGTTNVDVLGPKRDNLLTPAELEVIGNIPWRSRASVVWTWILLLATKVMEENAIAPSKHRDVIAQVVKSIDAIDKITTYLQSQLPFAYVHLVTLLVNLNNLVMAMKCGVVLAAQWEQQNYMYMGMQVMYLYTVPTLYQGLLSVSYIIHDPFGEDLLDFPLMAYQEYTNEACVALANFTHQCPALSKEYGSKPSKHRMSLIHGAGKEKAALLLKEPIIVEAVDAVTKEEQQRERFKEQEASLLAKMKSQDDFIASLRKQNAVLSSNLKELNTQAQARDPSDISVANM